MKSDLLKQLCEFAAISGHEDNLISFIVSYLKKSTDDIHVDKLGNVTATFRGSSEKAASLAFFAHLDELGLIVKTIEDNGFLRVERVGGVPERCLVSQQVNVHSLDDSKSYPAVVGTVSHHITPDDKKYVVAKTSELYLDLGLSSRQEVWDWGIEVGSMVTYANNYLEMNDVIVSKALDDRVGVYALLQLASQLAQKQHEATIYLIFSVQEEFNIRAATPTFNRLLPDAAICLDITPACDTPETQGRYNVRLNAGPALTYMNFHGRGTLGGLLPNPKLNSFIREIAQENGIALQNEVVIGVITEDAFTQHCGTEGIAMAHISLPLRYTHTPREMVAKADLEDTVTLLLALALAFNSKIDLSRGSKPE